MIKKISLITIILYVFNCNVAIGSVRLMQSIYHHHELVPVIKDGYFFNHENEWRFKHVYDSVITFIANNVSKKTYHISDPSEWIQHDVPTDRSVDLRIQWIGHASFLIQINNINIVTDPVFYDINRFICKRKMPVGINPEQLPTIDCILISHNHRDHTDDASLRFLLPQQPLMLVPDGMKSHIADLGFLQVYEHHWWQESIIQNSENDTINITFVPADHWSGRSLLDAHTSLWGGWIVKTAEKTVYFAGDTAFSDTIFKAIAEYAGTIDCAILPIGPCEPQETERCSHMDPTEAVEAFNILNAKTFIPMHWGTFAIGQDSFDTPIKMLDMAWNALKTVDSKMLYKIKFGESIFV